MASEHLNATQPNREPIASGVANGLSALFQVMTQLERAPLNRLRYAIDNIDPGMTRVEQTGKAGLALVTTAVVAALVLEGQLHATTRPVVYSVLVTFQGFLVVTDGQPRQRQRTLLLASLPFMLAPLVVGALQSSQLAVIALLLAAVFVSHMVRTYGQRASELGSATVRALYFSWFLGATPADAPVWALGAAIGSASGFAWTFILKPYRPDTYLVRALRAYGECAAAVVDALIAQPASSRSSRAATAALRHVQTSRRVIEHDLAAVSGAGVWTGDNAAELRIQLFVVEQDLQRLAESSAALRVYRGHMPAPLLASVERALAALSAALASEGAADQMRALDRAGAQMVAQARPTAGADEQWQTALPELESAVRDLTQAIPVLRRLAAPQQPARAPATAAPPQPAAVPLASQVQSPGLRSSTTRIAIQAVVACGAAMLVSTALHLTHLYWAFWTAYSVVAGPTGVSLQKMIQRVLGTVLGAVFGALLVVVLPPDALLLLTLQLIAMMLVLYTYPTSYPWMVFWLTTYVALLEHVVGEPLDYVLVDRPIVTVVSAFVAAIVVWWVFPVRSRDTFSAALASYLAATDAYLGTLAGSVRRGVAPATVHAAGRQAADAYEALTQMFASLALENRRLLQVRSSPTPEAKLVIGLHADVDRFAQLVAADGDTISAEQAAALAVLQGTIRANIATVQQQIADASRQASRADAPNIAKATTPPAKAGDEPAPDTLAEPTVAQLRRINQTIIALSASLATNRSGGAT